MISPPRLPQLLRANHHCRLPSLSSTPTVRPLVAWSRSSGPSPPHPGGTQWEVTQPDGTRRAAGNGSSGVKVKASGSQVKEKWLDSMSCPFPSEVDGDVESAGKEAGGGELGAEWVLGVDPDMSGALALLKQDASGCSAQVFDTPYLQVSVGKRARKRPDAKSMVLLLHSLGAPRGTNAYIEQSTPFPKDGKQGWWSGGYTYGLWIGVLVASGFSVVPVSSRVWKDYFELSGGRLNKPFDRMIADARLHSCFQLQALSCKGKKTMVEQRLFLLPHMAKVLVFLDRVASRCYRNYSVVLENNHSKTYLELIEQPR